MTFSLKKTLSRIQARRRSADSIQVESPPLSSTPRKPLSTELVTSPTTHPPGDASVTPPLGSSNLTVTPFDGGIEILNARLATLEAENAELQAKIESLTLDAQIREEELSKFRCEYYTELSETIVRRREATATQERLDQKLAQAQRFISSIVETGLHNPVLSEAWRAVKAGKPADDALVDSIKKAASRPGTSWSTIVPAITGPRTPEHYLSAINLTLKTRRELKKAIQVGRFWKKTAKMDSAHNNTVTPSSSNLSDLSTQPLSEERQTAVDDLLAKLRSGQPPVRSMTKDSSSSLLKTVSQVSAEAIPVPTSCSCGSVPASVSVATVTSATSMNSLLSDLILDPFNSLSLEAAPHTNLVSTEHGSHPINPAKHSRPVLRSIDLNSDAKFTTTPTMYVPKQSTRSLEPVLSAAVGIFLRFPHIVTDRKSSVGRLSIGGI